MSGNRSCENTGVKSFIENDNTKVTIFFNENRYSVEKQELREEIGSYFMQGLISYADISCCNYGRIVLEINPTRASGMGITTAAERMVDFIIGTDQAAKRS